MFNWIAKYWQAQIDDNNNITYSQKKQKQHKKQHEIQHCNVFYLLKESSGLLAQPASIWKYTAPRIAPADQKLQNVVLSQNS